MKYLFEVDTSDNKRILTARVLGITGDLIEAELIKTILISLLKNSLRWPVSVFKDHTLELCSVRHASTKDYAASWFERIKMGLIA